jgi:hypothetical protein
VIIGYVNPEDVDWEGTLELNYNNPEEYELRLNTGAIVEIEQVIMKNADFRKRNEPSVNLPLKGTMLVKA